VRRGAKGAGLGAARALRIADAADLKGGDDVPMDVRRFSDATGIRSFLQICMGPADAPIGVVLVGSQSAGAFSDAWCAGCLAPGSCCGAAAVLCRVALVA